MAWINGMNAPAGMGLLSAGAAMMDPRGTYGSFGAALNNGMQAGMGTYLPLARQAMANEESQRRNKLMDAKLSALQNERAMAAQARQLRAQQMTQLQTMFGQGHPQQAMQYALGIPDLTKPAFQGLLGMNQPTAEPLERVMVGGQPRLVPRSQAAGMTPYTNPGMALQVDPQTGQVTFSQGAQLPSPVKNTLTNDVFNAYDQMARLNSIQRSFKPEYLQLPTQLGMKWDALKDKSGMVQLSPAEKQELSQYSQFRAGSLEDLNLYIRSITGAQLNKDEVPRIKGALPNVDDSPTEFEAKMGRSVEMLKNTVIRKQYALKHGIDWKSIPLHSVPALVEERGKQVEAQLRRQFPNLPQVEIEQRVREQLSQEFGL